MRMTLGCLLSSASLLLLGALCLLACDPGSSAADAGLPDAIECRHDSDCRDDGMFCNGVPKCVTQTFMTDHGPWRVQSCMRQPPPCAIELCDEVHDSCRCPTPDADGDGHSSWACGGDDCDDNNAQRYPGHAEVCDTHNLDEDCDPSTFGFRDQDGDGSPDAQCCNGDVCGYDCDDTAPGVHPDSVEACDRIDNDCDGAVDEGVRVMGYRDDDADGWGTGSARDICAGLTGYAINDGDCDDAHSEVHPGAFRCVSGSNIELCSERGTFMADTCPGLGLCVPQPDGSGVCLPGDTSPQPQCSDGIDNDHDGQTDWSDPQCVSPLDNTEAERACADGMDNDDDGRADYPNDPGCSSLEDNDEDDPSTLPACSNGTDDDGDGTVDYAGGSGDPGCISAADENERQADGRICDNGIDDDGDTFTDYPADGSCPGPNSDAELTPSCSNSIDDDFDGLIDYPNDPGCTSATDDSERQVGGNYACDNGADDDADGVADYPADPQCSGAMDGDEAK